jgi:hypothetical protein
MGLPAPAAHTGKALSAHSPPPATIAIETTAIRAVSIAASHPSRESRLRFRKRSRQQSNEGCHEGNEGYGNHERNRPREEDKAGNCPQKRPDHGQLETPWNLTTKYPLT